MRLQKSPFFFSIPFPCTLGYRTLCSITSWFLLYLNIAILFLVFDIYEVPLAFQLIFGIVGELGGVEHNVSYVHESSRMR